MEFRKDNMSEYCKNCYELQEQLDQLKAELEQEKALKETYLACYKAKHEDIEGALFKLKQTLTEIKEIAEKQCNICEALTPIDEYKDCKKCWQGVILRKISECEVK